MLSAFKSKRNVLILLVGNFFLFGCASHVKLSALCTQKYYPQTFADSAFYQGWQLIDSKGKVQGCALALPYFERGITQYENFELSMLYYDYCVGSPDSFGGYKRSSIYSGSYHGVPFTYYEQQWLDEMAVCKQPVEAFALGMMLLNGHKLEKNKGAAIYFLSVAAHSGHAQAQMQLAMILFEHGEVDNAKLWLEKAVDNGYPGSEELLRTLNTI